MVAEMQCTHPGDIGDLVFTHIPKNAGSSLDRLGGQLLQSTGRGWGRAHQQMLRMQSDRERTFWTCMLAPGQGRCRDPDQGYDQASIPKDAACLQDAHADGGPLLRRWTAADFQAPRCTEYHLPPWRRPEYYERRRTFCVVRAPESRVISEYRWLHSRKGDSATFSPFGAETPCSAPHLNEWVMRHLLPKANRLAFDCHGLPQAEYLRGPAGCSLVLRLEWLARDFAKLGTCFGFNATALPHSNARPHACGMGTADLYPETLAAIYETYRTDYDLFGYPPPYRPHAARRDAATQSS